MPPTINDKLYISTATTTQIYTGPVRLVYVNINKALTGTVTIQDGDGTTNTTFAVYAVGTPAQSFLWNATFSRGLRVITSAADDVTIIY